MKIYEKKIINKHSENDWRECYVSFTKNPNRVEWSSSFIFHLYNNKKWLFVNFGIGLWFIAFDFMLDFSF